MDDAKVDLRVQCKRVLRSCVNDLEWDKVVEKLEIIREKFLLPRYRRLLLRSFRRYLFNPHGK